jgi:hypothetical protein
MDDLVDVLVIQAEVIEPASGQDVALRNANDQPVLGTLLAAQSGEGPATSSPATRICGRWLAGTPSSRLPRFGRCMVA